MLSLVYIRSTMFLLLFVTAIKLNEGIVWFFKLKNFVVNMYFYTYHFVEQKLESLPNLN